MREAASLVGALHGIDALVFTGAIGENAAPVREGIVTALGWLGFELDPAANAANDRRITRASSRLSGYVVATDEELMIARHTRSAMA